MSQSGHRDPYFHTQTCHWAIAEVHTSIHRHVTEWAWRSILPYTDMSLSGRGGPYFHTHTCHWVGMEVHTSIHRHVTEWVRRVILPYTHMSQSRQRGSYFHTQTCHRADTEGHTSIHRHVTDQPWTSILPYTDMSLSGRGGPYFHTQTCHWSGVEVHTSIHRHVTEWVRRVILPYTHMSQSRQRGSYFHTQTCHRVGAESHTSYIDMWQSGNGGAYCHTQRVGAVGMLPSALQRQCLAAWHLDYYRQSNFPLIQPSFVKLTQLAQFEKKKKQSCMVVHWWLFEAQVVQKAQWPIWVSIRLIILGPGFNSHQSFSQCLRFLANLTNLLSCYLVNTQMCHFSFVTLRLVMCWGYLKYEWTDRTFK